MPESMTVTMKRHLVDPNAAPTPAHKFQFTRVGTDIVLEVGYYDLAELRQVIEATKASPTKASPTEPPEVTLYVTARFVLSPTGVNDLAQVVQQLHADVMTNIVANPPEADKK